MTSKMMGGAGRYVRCVLAGVVFATNADGVHASTAFETVKNLNNFKAKQKKIDLSVPKYRFKLAEDGYKKEEEEFAQQWFEHIEKWYQYFIIFGDDDDKFADGLLDQIRSKMKEIQSLRGELLEKLLDPMLSKVRTSSNAKQPTVTSHSDSPKEGSKSKKKVKFDSEIEELGYSPSDSELNDQEDGHKEELQEKAEVDRLQGEVNKLYPGPVERGQSLEEKAVAGVTKIQDVWRGKKAREEVVDMKAADKDCYFVASKDRYYVTVPCLDQVGLGKKFRAKECYRKALPGFSRKSFDPEGSSFRYGPDNKLIGECHTGTQRGIYKLDWKVDKSKTEEIFNWYDPRRQCSVRALRSGTTSDVYHCSIPGVDGSDVAVKALVRQDDHDDQIHAHAYRSLESFVRESELLLKLKRSEARHVVKIVGYLENPPQIALEYLAGGSLNSDEYAGLPEKLVQVMARQLFQAVSDVHKVGIMHRDIQPDNIGVSSKQGVFQLKLMDFGSAIEAPTATESLGSPAFMAPEMSKTTICPSPQHRYSNKVDVWAAVLSIYAVYCSFLPFWEVNGETNVCAGGKFLFPEDRMECDPFTQSCWKIPVTTGPRCHRGDHKVSEAAKDFFRTALVADPGKRPSADELLEHKWLKEDENQIKKVERKRSRLST